MSSQRSSSLSQTSDECFAIDEHNFSDLLPRLKELLSKTDRKLQFRAIKILFGPCVTLCSPLQLAETLLDDAAPVARRLFFEIINEIDGLISSTTFNVIDDVGDRLESCEDLLECWLRCLAQLGKFDKLSASQVKTVLENLVEVIKRSFDHCKSSEEVYGDSFEKLKEKLTTLFRKTNEVQKLFSATIERVVVFNKDLEIELSSLAKVVGSTGEICSLVDGLDMKTMAESWKGFTRISVAYCNELKQISPPCVTPHLSSLANAVSSSLHSTIKDGDKKTVERSVKLQKLFLKIIHKLCICYSGYLGRDASSSVLRLLVQLHRYSTCYSKQSHIRSEIFECIETNLVSGIDQLLDSVINDGEFKQAFFENQTTRCSDNIGYHILTIFLINKLINNSNEIIMRWRSHPYDIIEVAINNLNSIEEELFVGQLRVETLPIFDSTLISVCGLVASTSDVNFSHLEIILLKFILAGEFWSSLLASDVWCFVNKSASSDLNYDHILYLMSVYEILIENRGFCTETVILGNLISRLYSLSSSGTKNRLTDQFESTKARFWEPLKPFISHNDKTFLSELTSTDIGSVSSTWEALENKPSAETWSRLANQLTVIGIFGKAQDESVSKTLTNIWNCVEKSSDEFDGIHRHIINQLIVVLLDATQSLQKQDQTICPILSILLTSLIPRGVHHLRGRVSYYLKESVENWEKFDGEKTSLLEKIYCYLLNDSNPLCQQLALESFSYVTNVSYDEELVIRLVDAVAEVNEISDAVSFYLSQQLYKKLQGFTSLEIYLKEFYKICKSSLNEHVCIDREDSRREEKRRKLSNDCDDLNSGIRLSSDKINAETPADLVERLNRLSNDIDYILPRKKEFSKVSLDKLNIIVNKIISFNDI